MRRDALSAFFAVLFLSIFVGPAFANKRVALVIGNGAYAHAPHLPNRPTTPRTWPLRSNEPASTPSWGSISIRPACRTPPA
jgi:hypothetical protein